MDEKNLLTVFINAFRHCLDFKGRAGKLDYWGYFAVNGVLFLALEGLTDIFPSTFLSILGGIYALFSAFVGLSLAVRRLHDTNHSGWLVAGMFAALFTALLLLRLSAQFVFVLFSWAVVAFVVYIYVLLLSKGDELKNFYGEAVRETQEQQWRANICFVVYMGIVLGQFFLKNDALQGSSTAENGAVEAVAAEDSQDEKNEAENDARSDAEPVKNQNVLSAPQLPMHSSVE